MMLKFYYKTQKKKLLIIPVILLLFGFGSIIYAVTPEAITTYNQDEAQGEIVISTELRDSNLRNGLPQNLISYETIQLNSKFISEGVTERTSTLFSIQIGSDLVEFDANTYAYDMDMYLTVEELPSGSYKFSPAVLNQIYLIESIEVDRATFIISEDGIFGNYLKGEDRFEVQQLLDTKSPLQNGLSYAVYKDSNIVQAVYSYEGDTENREPINPLAKQSSVNQVVDPEGQEKRRQNNIPKSEYKIWLPDGQQQSTDVLELNQIQLQAAAYAQVVRAGSSSFYSARGSGWGSRLDYLWSGGGSEDVTSAFSSETGISLTTQIKFVFTSGGPTSSDCHTFRDDFISFMQELSTSDAAYDPDWGFMTTGHGFDEGTAGCAIRGSVSPSFGDTDNGAIGEQYSVNSDYTWTNRHARSIIMHEGGHVFTVLYNHHLSAEGKKRGCWGPPYWYQLSVMWPQYYEYPRCFYANRRDFIFGVYNEGNLEGFAIPRLLDD